MSEARSRYSRELKIEAVGLLESGKSGKEVEQAQEARSAIPSTMSVVCGGPRP